jgi:hypothetical protein
LWLRQQAACQHVLSKQTSSAKLKTVLVQNQKGSKWGEMRNNKKF